MKVRWRVVWREGKEGGRVREKEKEGRKGEEREVRR